MSKSQESVEVVSSMPMEIQAMGRCINILEALDIVSRARVIGYLHSKYFTEAMAKHNEDMKLRPKPSVVAS